MISRIKLFWNILKIFCMHVFNVHLIYFWNYFRPCWIWNCTICKYNSFPAVELFISDIFIGWFHGFGVKIFVFWFSIFSIYSTFFFRFSKNSLVFEILKFSGAFVAYKAFDEPRGVSMLLVLWIYYRAFRSFQGLTLHVLL